MEYNIFLTIFAIIIGIWMVLATIYCIFVYTYIKNIRIEMEQLLSKSKVATKYPNQTSSAELTAIPVSTNIPKFGKF